MTHGYLLGEELGTGGMGRVVAATRTWDGLKVALKVLHPRLSRDPLARRTIATEALATTALEHENVTTVLDLDEHPEHGMFLVSELVAGRPMRALLDDGLDLARGLAILRDVLQALRAAHAAGIVHGDLKPANVLVDAAGHVKVCDFGIAQIMAPLARGASRRGAAGTPRYMAPEQFISGLTLDPRTDLYAFGVMLYEVLYGEAPFPHEIAETLRVKARPPSPPALSASGEAAPFVLRALIASAIHPDLRRRPRFAVEALACVDAALASLAPDGPPSWPRRAHVPRGARSAIEDAAEKLGTTVDLDVAVTMVRPLALRSADAPSSQSTPSTPTLDDLDDIDELNGLDGPDAGAPEAAVAGGSLQADRSAPPGPRPLSLGATEILRTRHAAMAAASPARSGTETRTASGTFVSAFLGSSHLPGTALVHVRPPPLVGREPEQSRMREIAAGVIAERRAKVVIVTGPSGVGKSRLAAWIGAHVESDGLMEAASARFSSHAGPSASGLRGIVSALYAPSTSQVSRAVKASVAWIERARPATGLDQETLSCWLASRSESDAADPHGTASLALGALAAYAEARPLYLWFDDLASAEDGSLELVARLAEEAPELPILVVATVSDEAMADGSIRRRLAPIVERGLVMTLGSLDLEARAQLLERMLPLALGVADRAAARVSGNPLFIVQQIEQWVEARALVHTDAGLVPTDDAFDRELDHDALIAARVDAHLARSVEAVPVLFLLALLGPYGDGHALTKACDAHGIDASIVDLVVEEAICRGILRARHDEVTFAHASLRAATLRRCRADEWYARYAAFAAQAIAETTAVERPSARAYVAVLLRDAGDHARAFDTLIEAIETMARGGDHAQADRLLEVVRRWAAEAAAGEPAELAELAERRRDEIDLVDARSAYFQCDFPRVRGVLDPLLARLRAQAESGAAVPLLARSLGVSGHAYFFAGDVARAEATMVTLREAVPIARDPRSTLGCVLAHLEASIASIRGDAQGAFDAFHRSIDTDDVWMRWSVRGKLAEIAAARGDHEAARTFLRRARTECGALDVYQMRYLRETDGKLALARSERRDRRMYEEVVRAQGEPWSRTAARLALAAWDATFAPGTMGLTAMLALEAFAETPHDDLLSHVFVARIGEALRREGAAALAERARSMLAARHEVASSPLA